VNLAMKAWGGEETALARGRIWGTLRGDGVTLAGGRSRGQRDRRFGSPGAGQERAKALCVRGERGDVWL
jgi:hypothetical protein